MRGDIVIREYPNDLPLTIRFRVEGLRFYRDSLLPFSMNSVGKNRIFKTLADLNITEYEVLGLSGIQFKHTDDFILAKMAFS